MLIIYVQGDLTIGCDRYFLTLKEYPGTIMIYERGSNEKEKRAIDDSC